MPDIHKIDGTTSSSRVLSRECWHRPTRLKCCIRCGERKPLGEFYAYGYVTKQGKQSTRYESRCKPCARARRLAERDPEREAAAGRAFRAARPGYTAELARKYRQSEHGRAVKAKAQRLRKARMRSGQGDNPVIRAIYAQAMSEEALIQNCPVFDLPELGKKLHVDHRIPLSKGGQHHEDNLQILPIGINMRKGVSCPR